MKKMTRLALLLLVFPLTTHSQAPQKPNAADLYAQIQKLNFLGSVLYVAAHPDDENTRLISYMANHKHARTAYLSLTRGDGGQNLIGPELREQLGAIRTQELLEARKIDGGQQFFSRANDFGYSKTPAETLKIWDKDSVLSDVVYVMRKFRPDVIINRFDARTPGTTHGHHTASAMLSLEAFKMVASADRYPKQLSRVKTWQPQRIFFNTNWWFYGSREKFDQADKSKLYPVSTGIFYPLKGQSNQEIAALSRSRHQSQGFGNTGVRGEDTEYLEFLDGLAPQGKADIFEGIDTSWNRVKGGKPIGDLLAKVQREFNFNQPEKSIPDLLTAYAMIQKLDDAFWKDLKSEEIKQLLAGCAGLYLEAVAAVPETGAGTSVKLKVEAINRSNQPMTLQGIDILPGGNGLTQPVALESNKLHNFDLTVNHPADAKPTQPYWLEAAHSVGMYTVSDARKIGEPDVIRSAKAIFRVQIAGVSMALEKDIIYKYNDDVKGEVYRPFDVVPDVSLAVQDKVVLFHDARTKRVGVSVTAGKDAVSGNVTLEVPAGWTLKPQNQSFSIAQKGAVQTVYFELTAPSEKQEAVAQAVAVVDGKRFDLQQYIIGYEHICKQHLYKPAQVMLRNIALKTGKERVAYVMGAGDEVPESLRQMGYTVDVVSAESLSAELLKRYQVVVTGIRAYNTVSALAFKQQLLLDWVREGHTMIVQYNTLDDLVTKDMAPYKLKLSRDRVTEEDAAVTLLDPKHALLSRPNRISELDFKHWTQEQGLYYPSEWDTAFTPLLSSHDTGEAEKKGALLVAPWGKGQYIYTGLSFFRELPEGVSGAFRLMANLLSAGPQK